ncbi:MAG: hypothetical protein ACOYMM_11410 [Phycisphaerales bacterium]
MYGDDILGDDYAGDDYAGDDYAGDDYAGEDLLGDFLGAARRRGRQRRGGIRRRMSRGPVRLGRPLSSPPGWREAQAAPGVMVPTEQLLPLGFQPDGGSFSFISGGPTTIIFRALPQKPFRGERLVIDIARSAGAAANSVNVDQISVGTDLQIVSAAPFPAATFAPTAFGVRLSLTAAQPGIQIVVSTTLIGPALPLGETVTVVPVVLGRAIL